MVITFERVPWQKGFLGSLVRIAFGALFCVYEKTQHVLLLAVNAVDPHVIPKTERETCLTIKPLH